MPDAIAEVRPDCRAPNTTWLKRLGINDMGGRPDSLCERRCMREGCHASFRPTAVRSSHFPGKSHMSARCVYGQVPCAVIPARQGCLHLKQYQHVSLSFAARNADTLNVSRLNRAQAKKRAEREGHFGRPRVGGMSYIHVSSRVRRDEHGFFPNPLMVRYSYERVSWVC
jgi:hypothetical protein